MNNLRRHSLLTFFTLAFLFPWLIWGTTIAQSRGILSFHIPQPLAFWIGLTLATYLSGVITGGIPAIKDIISRIIRWRVQPIWYITALLFTGLLSIVSIVLHLLFGGIHQIGVLLSIKNLLPTLLFQVFFFLLTEETAWRGFALPRLQAKNSALIASLIMGLIWGFWHIPLFFIEGSFQSTIPFTGFVLSAVAMTILTTWIFNHTNGSVLIAAIFHAATDTTIAFTNVMTGEPRLFWFFIAVQWMAAFVIILVEGAAHLSRKKNFEDVIFNPTNSKV